ncbi:MAG: extracellular solute-binding protein [Defluviitaleaceae bacterium]|nr:extracellular solute-binding protein [Defluviitaleaceae bacterium]
MKKALFLCALLVGLLILAACNRNGGSDIATDASAEGPLLPWEGDTITFRGFGSDLGINEDPNAPVASLISEMIGNVEIEWELVPHGDREARVQLYLNAGDMPDFMWVSARGDIWNPGLADSGMFLDFNQFRDHMPSFNAMAAANPSAEMFTNETGQLVALPSMDNDQFPHGFFANMDVLNRFNIAIPTTFAELEAAMQLIADSDPDIVPFHTFWGMNYYLTIFARIMDVTIPHNFAFWNESTSQWSHHLVDDADYRRLVTTMADFFDRGFFHPEFMTMSGDQTQVVIASGNWAFTYTYGVQPNDWLGVGAMDENPIPFQGFLPPSTPAGNPAQVGLGHVSCNPGWAYAANRDVNHPAVLASVLDVVWSPEVSIAYQWGVEGESFYVDANGERQWLPEFLARGSDARLEMGIWNTLLPRFVTLREDLSDMRAQAPFVQELYRMSAEAVIRGDLRAVYPPLAPLFTQEQLEENAAINAAVATVRDEWVMQMIAGLRPMSDWDAMLSEVFAAADVNRLVENFNTAEPNPFIRPTPQQRNYLIP